MANRLARARAERGWKKSRLMFELRAAASRRNATLPKDESLARRVADWENKDAGVSDFYCELLCDVYKCTRADLGLLDPVASETVEDAAPDLSERPVLAKVDASLVELLRGQTQSLRLLDRRLGSAAVYRQSAAHVEYLERLVKYALPNQHRQSAADELGQAAALAGWQALDSGRLDDAWRHHQLARSAARESGVASGLAYASAQQAYVLLELGYEGDAAVLVRGVREQLAGFAVPPELLAWLYAAEGEVLAVRGRRDEALRALDAAERSLPATPEGALPYLMLDANHLARWRGHCLARLGEPSAIDDLSTALVAMGEGRYGRAEVSLRVDLALALRARGELAEAKDSAEKAKTLAGQTGSERQRRRIEALLSA